jgi:hypothetical protein
MLPFGLVRAKKEKHKKKLRRVAFGFMQSFLVPLGAYSLLLFNWGLIPFWFRWGIINLFVCTEGFLFICVAPVWIGSRKKRKTQKKLRRVAFGFMHFFLIPPGVYAFLVALGAYSLLLFNWGLIPFWFRWGIINLFVCTEGFLFICVAPVCIGSRKKRKTQKKLRRVAFGFMHSFLVPLGAHY